VRILIALAAVVLMTASAVGQTTPRQTLPGNLAARDARVSFPLQLQQGEVVTLTTSSAQNVDTILTLNGPNGRSVAQNDDIGAGVLQSRIVFVAPASGAYTAVVTGYSGARGAFELNVTRGLDLGLSTEARTLREERVTLDRRRTEMRYPVDLSAGDILVASTFALTAELDTTLSLVDANGAILAQNDDAAVGSFNSQIVYQIAAGGRYEVVASTYGGAGAGDFIFSLALDPNAEAPFNFSSIEGTEIARHEAELNDVQSSAVYRLELTAGQTLFATVDTISGNLDPVLRLSGPDGHPVAINDDRGDGSLNSALAYTAPVAGTYVLEVARFRQSPSSGGYRLVMSSVDASVVATLQALIENQTTLSGAEQVIETADFRVLYTLEGRDAATPEYARSVADTLQNMLAVQTRLGWAAPLRDPDGRYRAYVADAEGSMGLTKPVQVMFDNPNTANVRETAATRGVLVIENDFAGMGKKAPPESLMRATVTHELNHLIQYGYDGEEGLAWLYESTASWIETTTVGTDQDASDYASVDFAAPELCWTTTARGHDYGQWTLLQSLADSHGESIVVRMWENSVALDGFETMSRTLADVGTTIPDALQRWRVQNFARDYDLAPLFERSVKLGGAIARNGNWSPRGRIQQLGAHYVAVNVQGARSYTLRGDVNLELVGLGKRDGQIEVIQLGRGGVFNATGYEYAALMVFNRAMPAAPGRCSDVNYSIRVAAAEGAMAAPSYRVSAEHFAPPSP
jgi:hypothetical protein